MGLAGTSKYGGNRGGGGRLPYGIMLLLAFGAAVFGVMVLHKFRERRIFNILIKDKDTHIITLQLLLQKEKDYTKEMKKKIEEMKAKAFSLRTQKVELNNKIMDMQSLIASLKEEVKALESELEEKRNESKMLRDKEIDSSNESSQVAALTELLKQKEAEIEDMNHRLENPVNVWSVSTDDPSKPVDSLSAKATNVVEKSIIEEGEEAVMKAKDGEVLAANSEGGFGNATEGASQTEVQEGKLLNIENNQNGEGLRNAEEIQERREVWGDTKEKSDDSHNDEDFFRMSGEKGNKNETEMVESSREDHQVLKTKVEDADKKPLENSHNGDGQVLGKIISGGDEIKMEVADDDSQNAARTDGEENELRSKTMNKRWRKISRNRELEKNESFKEGEGGLEKNVSDEDLKDGLGDFAGKKLREVFRNRKLELPENQNYDESLITGTDSSDDRVGLEVNEHTTMVSSSDGKLEHNQQIDNSNEAGEGLKLRSENANDSRTEETNDDSNQAMNSINGQDSGTKETNATDSNQQQKKPTEPGEQQLGNGVQNATDDNHELLLPETHSMTTVLKRQRLPLRRKIRKFRMSTGITN